jgi:hypothetical protein
MEVLLLVAERDGPEMLARIAVMKALNRHTLWDAPRLSAWKLEDGPPPDQGLSAFRPERLGASESLRRMIRKFSHLLKFTVSYRDGLQPIVSAGTLASYCVAAAAASLRSALPMRRCEYCASWYLLHYAPARCCSVSCGAAMTNKRTSPHAFRAEEAEPGPDHDATRSNGRQERKPVGGCAMSQKTGDECTFRQRDLKEAIKAARNAGLENSIRRRSS